MKQKSMMSPTEEENYKLLEIQMWLKVNDLELFIYRLKKSAPVSDADLEEMWTRRTEVRNAIVSVQNAIPESTLSTRRPFKLMLRKLLADYNDIYENYTEEGDSIENWLENHSDSKDLDAAQTSPDEQLPSPVTANIEAIATKSKKKRKKQQRQYLLKPTPRPTKLNKATTMKILLRRKMMIPNRVRNLLDPARRPQCHPFPFKGRMKKGLHKCTQLQPVPSINSRQIRRRHLSLHGSYRQSTASSSRLSTKTGEAVFGNASTLSSEDKLNNYTLYIKDQYTKIPRADAVQVWLFHDHYI